MSTIKEMIGVGYSRASNFDNLLNSDGKRRADDTLKAHEERARIYVDHISKTKGVAYKLIDFITDEGFSGKNTKRPGYQKLISLIKTGKIDFILATELSRLSRSVIDFLELVQLCEQHNVAIIILGLNIDTSSVTGRVVVVILVALAEFERNMARQRVVNNTLTRLIMSFLTHPLHNIPDT